jgi:6-phosphogluconate dehydrogenase
MPQTADIALIGLAVMGQNIVLNMNDHGYVVAVYNRTVSKVDEFIGNEAKGTRVVGAHSLEELVGLLKKPRRVMMLVKAGAPVDEFIDLLLPLLEKGDIIIDGGNSFYEDTVRRYHTLKEKGILFVGSGVSGGEEGARHGPSLMPGGNADAWPHIKAIFQSIAAKVDNGVPCCDWVGDAGAGHFVKMVHNGIEYGDMQLISEAYSLLSGGLGLDNEQLANTFTEWNKTELDSYLIEITSHIFKFKEPDGGYLVDKILDAAGQKGTGKWTVLSGLDNGAPVTLIAEAVFARIISSLKDERVAASTVLAGPTGQGKFTGDVKQTIEDIRLALYASKIISYAQGYMLMKQVSDHNKWKLNLGGIALMWRGGCIIRSRFLGDIKAAYDHNPTLTNLVLDPFFTQELKKAQDGWRRTIALGATLGIPTPTFSNALAFYDSYRSARLPANLLQAQRDYFGAHTYERIDEPRGKWSHTNWTGQGGTTASTTYNA